MDHSPYIEQRLDNAQRDAAERHAEVKRLEALLDEATRLLFVQGGKPSRELFGWWFRRDYERKQKKAA